MHLSPQILLVIQVLEELEVYPDELEEQMLVWRKRLDYFDYHL